MAEQKIIFRCLESPEIRKDEKDEARKMTFVASDGTRDSAGTVLNQDNWDLKRFNSNGVIGYQHKVYGGWDDTDNPDNIIGKGHAYIEESNGKKRLLVDVEFEPEGMNELADKVYRKLEFGTLKAVSVGFMPLGGDFGKGEESADGSKPTYYYRGQELVEVSVVNIPANPNALRRSMEEAQKEMESYIKSALEDAPGETKSASEPEPEPEPEPKPKSLELEKTIAIARAILS